MKVPHLKSLRYCIGFAPMSELSSKTFVIVNPILIDELLANYRLYKSIGYLRNKIKEIKSIGAQNYSEREEATKQGDKIKYIRFVKVPYNVLDYMVWRRSKSEILVLFYFMLKLWHTPYDEYARFKIKDLSEITGVDRRRLSRALNHLIKFHVIERERVHPNYVIRLGHIYRYGPSLQKVPGKMLATRVMKRGHRG